ANQRVSLQTGKTYALTVWGSMTRRFDVAFVGIVFRDANGVRLKQLEPEMLEFTATGYHKQELTFTVDARVTQAHVFVWKRVGGAGFFTDDFRVRQVKTVEDEEPTGTTVSCQSLMVPGYFDPRTTPLWEKTTSTGTGVG